MGDVGIGRALRLNGEAIHITSAMEDLSVKEILDRTEDGCLAASAGLGPDALGAVERSGSSLAGPPHLPYLPASVTPLRAAGVLRHSQGESGVVACLVRPPGVSIGGIKDLVDKLSELVATGDLSRVGLLRYVYAEKTASGRTHVVVVWTDGPFNFLRLLPTSGGDAPGSDPADAPRPPRGHRLLSANFEGVPYGVRIYDTAASPSDVIGLYDGEMPTRGWQPTYGAPRDGKHQRAFSKDGVDMLVLASPNDGRTIVSILEVRAARQE
jgi:hypothetical protein